MKAALYKMTKKFGALMSAVMIAAFLAYQYQLPEADAAVTNIAPANGQVVYMPFHLSGTYSATTTGVAKFNMPMPCKMVGVSSVPRALTGVGNTIDVLLGGTSILSAPMATTAGTVTEGTITTSAITDEGAVTINLAIPSGTLVDSTVLLTCVRR